MTEKQKSKHLLFRSSKAEKNLIQRILILLKKCKNAILMYFPGLGFES